MDKEKQTALLKDPQQNLIPLTKGDLKRVLATEANYDRWSNFLFPPIKSNDLYEVREKRLLVELPDGSSKEACISVIPAKDNKGYTDKTYDVFLALQEIWQDKGMTDDIVEIYLGDIAKKLDLKENGRVAQMIFDELLCLSRTTVSWVFTFETLDTKQNTVEDQRIFDYFKYSKKEKRLKGTTSAKCKIRFSEHIRDNFRSKITIPVNFEARKSIRSNIAKCLYNRLDNILAKASYRERSANLIIEDLNLVTPRYKYKSRRYKLLQTLQKNLHGVELSQKGYSLDVGIQETANGSDWKLILKKQDNGKTKRLDNKPHIPIVNYDENQIEHMITHIDELIGGRAKNAGLYRKFAQCYSDTLIFRSIAEYKEVSQHISSSVSGSEDKKQRYFTGVMHQTAHKMGMEWINDCGTNCQKRPENNLLTN